MPRGIIRMTTILYALTSSAIGSPTTRRFHRRNLPVAFGRRCPPSPPLASSSTSSPPPPRSAGHAATTSITTTWRSSSSSSRRRLASSSTMVGSIDPSNRRRHRTASYRRTSTLDVDNDDIRMQSSGLVFGMHRYHRYFESMYDDAGRDDDDENDNGIVPTMASPPPSMEAGGDDVVGEDVIASGSMLGGGTHAPPHRTDAVPSTTTTSIESGGDDDARDDVAIPSDAVDATAIADTTNNIVPDRTYVLRFDGGSRGNPGRAGAGMVLYDGMDGDEIWSGYHYLGDKYTNNEAEYRGLITGLRCALSLGIRRIVIQGDSQLILRQLDGRYRVKSPTLLSYYHEALSLVREFDSAETGHIERSRNSRADELANLAMDSRSSMGFTN